MHTLEIEILPLQQMPDSYINPEGLIVTYDGQRNRNFKCSPNFLKEGENEVLVTCNGLSKWIVIKAKNFECHYNGKIVRIGKEFNPKDLHAHTVTSEGEWKELWYNEFTITPEDFTIKAKENYFIAEYDGLTDIFCVYGYDVFNATNGKYSLWHYNAILKTWVDVGESYSKHFMVSPTKAHFSVGIFDNVLEVGLYKLIAPKNTGLCKKYASEWTINKSIYGVRITLDRYFTDEKEEEIEINFDDIVLD